MHFLHNRIFWLGRVKLEKSTRAARSRRFSPADDTCWKEQAAYSEVMGDSWLPGSLHAGEPKATALDYRGLVM